MFDFFEGPFHWALSGFLISFTLIALIYLGKTLGASSIFRTICSMGGAGKRIAFFNYNWKGQYWNILFIIGVFVGGYLSEHYLTDNVPVAINQQTIQKLEESGFQFDSEERHLLPTELYGSTQNIFSILLVVIGGFLVGFGARYAGGCTSGHAITGLSNLQIPSLLAVIGFFTGGLIMIHFIFPVLF